MEGKGVDVGGHLGVVGVVPVIGVPGCVVEVGQGTEGTEGVAEVVVGCLVLLFIRQCNGVHQGCRVCQAVLRWTSDLGICRLLGKARILLLGSLQADQRPLDHPLIAAG